MVLYTQVHRYPYDLLLYMQNSLGRKAENGGVAGPELEGSGSESAAHDTGMDSDDIHRMYLDWRKTGLPCEFWSRKSSDLKPVVNQCDNPSHLRCHHYF